MTIFFFFSLLLLFQFLYIFLNQYEYWMSLLKRIFVVFMGIVYSMVLKKSNFEVVEVFLSWNFICVLAASLRSDITGYYG